MSEDHQPRPLLRDSNVGHEMDRANRDLGDAVDFQRVHAFADATSVPFGFSVALQILNRGGTSMIRAAILPSVIDLVRDSAHSLAHNRQDYDPLPESINDVGFTLFGGAPHGTPILSGASTVRVGCAALDDPRMDWGKTQLLSEAARRGGCIGGHV
jgi:hypothetical protein